MPFHKILDVFKAKSIPEPVIQTTHKPCELVLLDSQLESASEQHAMWATKYYLQLVLDGLPSTTAAKQTSFKFFGSYQSE